MRRWFRLLWIGVVGGVLVWAVFHFLRPKVARVSRTQKPLVQVATPWDEPWEVSVSGVDLDRPRNLILFIVDGLGFAHLSASRAVLHGIHGPAIWDRFPATGWHRTQPVRGFLTDSAASATALATGYPTYPDGIGVDAQGEPLETLFERAAELGYRTGIVTDSYVWDATPAAFVAHIPERDDEAAGVVLTQLGESSLEILVGELEDVGEGSIPEWDASVELFRERFEVLGPESDPSMLATLEASGSPTVALFEEDQIGDLESEPNLPSLVTAALRRLNSTDDPFLLLVESEEIDSASHEADLERVLWGMEAIEATLELILDFAAEDGETLVVFTSDHETGGLALSARGRNQKLHAIWSTSDHTGTAVPLLAIGPGSEAFVGSHANWEIGRLLTRALVGLPQDIQR